MPIVDPTICIAEKMGSCIHCPLELREKREKPGVLQANVDRPPEMEDAQLRRTQALFAPVTVASSEKIGPAPLAL